MEGEEVRREMRRTATGKLEQHWAGPLSGLVALPDHSGAFLRST
jgi:hypothetical protein